MKRSFVVGAILFLVGMILPGLGIMIGDHYSKGVSGTQTKQQISHWRKARIAYRGAQFSPVFWSKAKDSETELDMKLSQNMFSIVIRGADEKFNYEEHLKFLSSRNDSPFWTGERALNQIRYGQHAEALESLNDTQSKHNHQSYGLAASMFLGDAEKLKAWMKVGDFTNDGLYFLVDEQPEITEKSSNMATLIKAHKSPKETNWDELWENSDENYRPYVSEAFARSEEANPEKLKSWLQDAPSNLQWACAHLAAASYFPETSELFIDAGLQPLLQEDRLHNRFTIGANIFCHAETFDSAAVNTLDPEKESWLRLFSAHSSLGQFLIADAQKTLKNNESSIVSNEQKIFNFHLRSLAREMAGDLVGLERYARKGEELHKGLFTTAMGKAALLRTQKSEAIWLLHGHGPIELPESISPEYNDLCSVAQRVNGNAVKVKINGEDVPYGLWERNSEFRQWFSKHLNKITEMPPKPSTALTILVNSQRALNSGDFLMKLFTGDQVQPHNVAARSHLEFLFNVWRPSGSKKNKWKQFVKARTWLSALPYPQMLQQFPEQFIVKLGAS